MDRGRCFGYIDDLADKAKKIVFFIVLVFRCGRSVRDGWGGFNNILLDATIKRKKRLPLEQKK